MVMQKRLHKIISFTLAIVVTCCSLGLNFPTSASATSAEKEDEKLIGNEFYLDFADISGEELDKYFTAGRIISTNKAENVVNVNASEVFTTDPDPAGKNETHYHNNYLKPKFDDSTFSVLTLKDTTVTNFKLTLEYLEGNSLFGVFFGTDSTPTDELYLETESWVHYNCFKSSGYGQIRTIEQGGRLHVQGIDVNSSNWEDSEGKDGIQFNRSTDAVRTRIENNIPNVNTALSTTDAPNVKQLNVEVLDGKVKVWFTGFESYAWTSSMLETYKGGSISIYMNRCNNGGIKSLSLDNFDGNYQEFYKDFTNVDASELDGYFTAGKVYGAGHTEDTKPSDLFTSDENPTGNVQWIYQNNYLKPKEDDTGLAVLTLKDTTAVNFKLTLEFLEGNSVFGAFFGTDSTPTDDIVMEKPTDNSNPHWESFQTSGYGHVHTIEEGGRLFVQGIDATTSDWVDSAGKEGQTLNKNTTYVRTRNDHPIPKMDSAISTKENPNIKTLNIEVLHGTIKVWYSGFESYAWTSQMLDYYDGGSISIYMNICNNGGLKSISFENYGGYVKSFTKADVSDLNEDFDARYYSARQNGTVTTDKVENLWSKSSGYLRPVNEADNGITLLTLKNKQYKNFHATVDIAGMGAGWQSFGLYFGHQDLSKGSAVTTREEEPNGSNPNVRVYIRSNKGALAASGVLENSKQSVGTTDVSFNSGSGWVRNANVDSALEGFNTSTEANVTHRMNIEVIDGVMKVWWEEAPHMVWQAEVNEYYRGGYISVYGMKKSIGGIKRLCIRELPENEYTFAVTDPAELDDMFTSTVFDNTNGTVETKEVSESWMIQNGVSEEAVNVNAEYRNNSLKPFKDKNSKYTYVLTLKEELSDNFVMDFTQACGFVDAGLYLSDNLDTEPVSSPSADSVKVSFSNPGDGKTYLRIYGAIDIDSATVADSTIIMNNYVSSVNVPIGLSSEDYDAKVRTNLREQVHVQVKDRKLTAWVEGYENAKVTVSLTADFNADKLSFFSNGNNQGGFVSMNVDMLPDDATFTSNINFDIQPIGEYTKVTLSTDLDHSSILGTLNFDKTRYEYFGATLNEQQIVANQGDYVTVGDGTIALNLRVNPQNEVLNLYFKNLDTSLNYESMLANDVTGYVANQNEVNVVTTRELDQDYTDNFILDVKDVVRAKVQNSTTVEDVRKVLVGANAETESPLLGKTALYLGDSIAYGSNDKLGLSWAGRIAQRGMTYDKVAVSGWTVTNTETSGRGQIVTQLDNNALKTSYDFVILEGGVNDVLTMQGENNNITWGEVDDDSVSYDTSTIAGAIEDLIVKTQDKFPDAIVGYVINNYFGATEDNMTTYINTVKAACDKHGVAYVDLNADERTGESVFYRDCELYDDGWLHPNAAGYDIIAPVIAEWMERLVLGKAGN